MLGLSDLELVVVELQLLTLQNVTVSSSALARPGRDNSEESTSLELLLKEGVDLGNLLALLKDSLDVVALLLVGLLSDGRLGTSESGLGVVRLVPLSEGGSVDVDNGTLDEGLGSEKLVVGGVVSNLDQPSLPGDRLGTPSKVTGVESESPVLDVTASGSDLMDTFGRVKLGHGGLTTKFELSLLSVVGTTSTGGGALVARVTSDTHSAKTGQSQASIIL